MTDLERVLSAIQEGRQVGTDLAEDLSVEDANLIMASHRKPRDGDIVDHLLGKAHEVMANTEFWDFTDEPFGSDESMPYVTAYLDSVYDTLVMAAGTLLTTPTS